MRTRTLKGGLQTTTSAPFAFFYAVESNRMLNYLHLTEAYELGLLAIFHLYVPFSVVKCNEFDIYKLWFFRSPSKSEVIPIFY